MLGVILHLSDQVLLLVWGGRKADRGTSENNVCSVFK